jgi:hypothetical protein
VVPHEQARQHVMKRLYVHLFLDRLIHQLKGDGGRRRCTLSSPSFGNAVNSSTNFRVIRILRQAPNQVKALRVCHKIKVP